MISALLEVTPYPPATDDVDELLAAAAAMVRARERVLAPLGVGLAAGTASFTALTERARRLNAELTGHRFLFGTIRVGGSDLVLERTAISAARGNSIIVPTR